MNRILILGPCGAGKSHLADLMGRKLKIPVYHLDSIFWNPGWVSTDGKVFLQRINEIAAGEAWIIDGNYSNYWGDRLIRCDTIILLDYSRRIHFYRTLMRILKGYGKVRSDMADGCPERLDWEFLKYSWDFRKNKMKNLYETVEDHAEEKKVIVFKKPGRLEAYLDTLDIG